MKENLKTSALPNTTPRATSSTSMWVRKEFRDLQRSTSNKLWPGWYSIPVRKPLAVVVGVVSLVICFFSFTCGVDIPPIAGGLLQTLVTVCIGAYSATSVVENMTGGKEAGKEKDE
jgi:hypothetical protein